MFWNTCFQSACVLFQVFCSRYVHEHMLFHSIAEEHLVVLSYSDLSVWCYACSDYVDNEVQYEKQNKQKMKVISDCGSLNESLSQVKGEGQVCEEAVNS